jgi:two-component system, LytTR family, response regulator
MTDKKVILVDDEAPARQLLREYLQYYPALKIVAECRNGNEALAMINSLQPDIVFLDIQMPGKTGFEVLKELEFIPQIIFSTAFDQFALKAFEVNAIDYLLKPYTLERFRLAIQKCLSRGDEMINNIRVLTESLQQKGYPERIFVEQGNKLISIAIADILWIEAIGDYTKLHTHSFHYISNKGISEMEQKLDPSKFQRIHRSAMINLSAIREVYKEASGPQVVLQNGKVLKVSRSYAEALRKIIF